MADVNRGNRPLSPFMLGKYYRFQLNSVTSIITRITGTALVGGGILVVWWFLAAATSAVYFEFADWLLTSWIGDLVMTLCAWALWFHLLAGVRHLIWDQGYALDVEISDKLGWAVVGGSVVLTLLTILIV